MEPLPVNRINESIITIEVDAKQYIAIKKLIDRSNLFTDKMRMRYKHRIPHIDKPTDHQDKLGRPTKTKFYLPDVTEIILM